MTTMELELQKAEIARMILSETDEKVLRKLFAFFAKEKKTPPPCQYSIEELREQIDISMNDYHAGRVVTMEEMRAKYPRL